MKVAGVIAEFDPFHNGHAYFLRKVREITSADFIIVVMSGDFTQRGNIAVAGKRLRTETALMNGADLVIELPVRYATASAEFFALGGVSILDSLGCVDALCFGTEEADLKPLQEMAGILAAESDEFRKRLDLHLREGMNYPAARMESIKETMAADEELHGENSMTGSEHYRSICRGVHKDRLADILSRPNNILALEYLKAINKTGSKMKPMNIRREAVDHDSANTYGIYSSAKNIRQILKTTRSLEAAAPYLPENTLPLLREHFDVDFPLFDDDMSSLMRYRLLMEDEDSLMRYADMNSDLAHRIINKRNDFINVSQFTELIKTRNLTYTRISRALLHVLLSLTKDDDPGSTAKTMSFARILGFSKSASKLMNNITANSSIHILSKASDYKKVLDDSQRKSFNMTLRAGDIYNIIIHDIYGTIFRPDITSLAIAKDKYVIL